MQGEQQAYCSLSACIAQTFLFYLLIVNIDKTSGMQDLFLKLLKCLEKIHFKAG
jgi:hypothetical protein